MDIEPPIILQSLYEFSNRMQNAWRDESWRPPAGRYKLNDAIVDLTYKQLRYGPEATVTVVEYYITYP